MARVVYSMSMSLDGFVTGPSGEIDWSVPDEELHQFHNDRVRKVGVQICGRRLYEVMLYWETVADDPDAGPVELEFAEIWQALPKVVCSRTLSAVEGNARLATGDPISELEAIREQAGDRDVAVGGAELAGQLARANLIDQYEVFVNPVVLGGGTPFFPRDLDGRIELELAETRTFASRVTYLRYLRA